MVADVCLNAGFLVGTEDVILGAESFAFPDASIEVQDRTGLLRELKVPWDDPVLIPSGLDGIASRTIEIQPTFKDFDDYWASQTLLANRFVRAIRSMSKTDVERLKGYVSVIANVW